MRSATMVPAIQKTGRKMPFPDDFQQNSDIAAPTTFDRMIEAGDEKSEWTRTR
jgi:hypothetical protein